MQIDYTGRQFTVTPALRKQAEEGMARIAKILTRIVSVHVILSAEKYRHCAELTVKTRQQSIVGISESTSMDTALREALEKAETQAIRHKKKIQSVKRQPKAEKIADEQLLARPRRAVPSATESAGENGHASESSNGRSNGVKTNGKRSIPARQPVLPVTVHTFPAKAPIPEPHVVRSIDSVALRPMSLEEAVKEAEFRDREVFVFRNNNGNLCVLHRKRDGKMELIEAP
jgi:putative sigma-54 modulation protein